MFKFNMFEFLYLPFLSLKWNLPGSEIKIYRKKTTCKKQSVCTKKYCTNLEYRTEATVKEYIKQDILAEIQSVLKPKDSRYINKILSNNLSAVTGINVSWNFKSTKAKLANKVNFRSPNIWLGSWRVFNGKKATS